MPTSSLAETEWVDIVPPVTVSASPDAAMVLLIVCVVLAIAITAAWFYSTRPRQQARRKLRSLIRTTDRSKHQPRDNCHVIARELGKAFGVTRLTAVSFNDTRQEHWQEFLQQLDRKRFSAEPLSGHDFAQLADQAVGWLRQR